VAFRPFQRVILSGSMRKATTISGLASMWPSRTTVRSASRRSASSWAIAVPPFVAPPSPGARALASAAPADGGRGRLQPGSPFLAFRGLLQRVQALLPEPLQEGPDLRQPLGPGPVQAHGA